MALRALSLFAGVGGLDLAVGLARECRVVCYVERECYAASVLAARMADETLDEAPVWSDVATFDGKPWRGAVDLITASPPCQPYSVAGARKGLDDERGGAVLAHVARIIEEVSPELVFLENVRQWWSGGYFRDFGEQLQRLGYRIPPALQAAARDVGAPHIRKRGFCLAHRDGAGFLRESCRPGIWNEDEECWHDVDGCDPAVADTKRTRPQGNPAAGCEGPHDGHIRRGGRADLFPPAPNDAAAWSAILEEQPERAPALESDFRRVVDGVAAPLHERANRLRCTGNGVVPLCGAVAFHVLMSDAGIPLPKKWWPK